MMFAALALAPVAVTVEETTYAGKPAFRLSNAAARVVVSPHLGGVVEYGFANVASVLYVARTSGGSGEVESAGDSVRYAVATTPEFPADAAWSGTPYKAERLPDGIRLTSERGRAFPLRLRREIRLDAYGTKLTFRNSLVNEGAKPITVALNAVATVLTPREIVLPTIATDRHPRGYALLQGALDRAAVRVEQNRLRIAPQSARTAKYGSKGGDGTVAATLAGGRLTTFSAFSRMWRYPERDSAKVVFTAPASVGFARIEHRTRLEELDPRQIGLQTVTWSLAPLSN